MANGTLLHKEQQVPSRQTAHRKLCPRITLSGVVSAAATASTINSQVLNSINQPQIIDTPLWYYFPHAAKQSSLGNSSSGWLVVVVVHSANIAQHYPPDQLILFGNLICAAMPYHTIPMMLFLVTAAFTAPPTI